MPLSYSSTSTCLVVTHRFNGAAQEVRTEAYNDKKAVVSIAEYRKLLNDHTTPDERIQARIEYLVSVCRNIVRTEIETYVKSNKDKAKQ